MDDNKANVLFDIDDEELPLADDYYESISKICKRFDLTKVTFYRLAAQNGIRRHRVGQTKLIRYRVKDVLGLLKEEGGRYEHSQDQAQDLSSQVAREKRQAMFKELQEKARSGSLRGKAKDRGDK